MEPVSGFRGLGFRVQYRLSLREEADVLQRTSIRRKCMPLTCLKLLQPVGPLPTLCHSWWVLKASKEYKFTFLILSQP